MTTIYIVQHYSYDHHALIGVFTDKRKARRFAFDYASRSFGAGYTTEVAAYLGEGDQLEHACTWKTPEPPEEPKLPDQYLEMQQQHEKALEEHEKALAAYEGIKAEFGGSE